ncbi:hypothetical protein M422DRAFT_32099 [Sphaerobolus stellatus SS14]|uniref:Uncharacterized protein n=1 Tax=Sphaerobolus stellatus (strain SS14) TaxID=990650 RepID=A0A0C9VHV2_SPHS4|nr:hypothetical protein M422DRAFT_32099 [Sphaerobolus stellatus SS14]
MTRTSSHSLFQRRARARKSPSRNPLLSTFPITITTSTVQPTPTNISTSTATLTIVNPNASTLSPVSGLPSVFDSGSPPSNPS